MTIPDWLRLRTAPGGARQPTGEVFLPLTAQQALEARREALALAEDEGALALCANACLVARGVRKGRRPFPSGKAVLAAYGPEEIEALARRWAVWNREENLGPDLEPGRLEALKAQLADLPWQRLQWRVLRQFRALPTEGRARAMTGEDYLWCAANLLLDGEEALDQLCPHCRQEAEAGRCPVCGRAAVQTDHGANPAFDWARFTALKEETET